MEKIYLSRRNLQTLLNKLDRRANDCATEYTACTIIKYDNSNPRFPQTVPAVMITAVEDDEYYADREPGAVHPLDVPNAANA